MEKTMDVAVIGMSGRFPDASNISEFCRNLSEGKDSVREISINRLSATNLPADKNYQEYAYMEDIDLFDHEFFNISMGEARCMDPQHRLLMEVVYETFENAGYNSDDFNGSKTSVYIGAPNSIEGSAYYRHAEDFDPTMVTGILNAAMAGRISRYFNLRGGSMMIDTACSSSLVALHLGINDLKTGDVDAVLVCGVNIDLFPGFKSSEIDQVGINASNGRAKAFSADADGTSSGEAIVSFLLKPLKKAVSDRDIIHAVIKGTAINQDADLSGSLTAPSSLAQSQVIKAAWEKAGIDPLTISYIETHGTGTRLGDPIEVEGIDLAFREITERKKFCAISSVKTNIGHTDSAAGMCGLAKSILSLKHKKLFPSLHFSNPNPLIDFENSATYVNTECVDWKLTDLLPVRRSGLSSFGISGTNCHVILEEYVTEIEAVTENGSEELLTVSAKNALSLEKAIREIVSYAKAHPELSLKNIAYTLNVGRKHYHYRSALCLNNLKDLSESNFLKAPATKKPGKLVLVFSGSANVSDTVIQGLCKIYPIFNAFNKECLESLGGNEPGEAFNNLVIQIGYYKVLESKGIKSTVLLGNGPGEACVAVITGKMKLADALKSTLRSKEVASEITSRCENLIKKLADNYVIFLEMGPNGVITKELDAVKNEKSNYNVASYSAIASDPVLSCAKDLYLSGYDIDWAAFYKEEARHKVELPTYQFNRKRCWLKEPDEIVQNNLFYQLEWEKQNPFAPVDLVLDGTILVFETENEIASSFIDRLIKQGNKIIKVSPAKEFESTGSSNYKLDWNNEAHYTKLKTSLGAEGDSLAAIVHFGGLSAIETETNDTDSLLAYGLYSLFFLTKAFHSYFFSENSSLLVVTGNARQVLKNEPLVNPFQSAIHGFTISTSAEYPALKVRTIDIDLKERELENIVSGLVHELSHNDDNKQIVSFRNGNRYLPKISKAYVNQSHSTKGVFVKEGGVYLITGGTSGIGLEVCGHIGTKHKIKLIVIGRRELPSKTEWKSIPQNIPSEDQNVLQIFHKLSENGTEVHYYSANVEDKKSIENIINEVNTTIGTIQGIIHSAGIPGKKRVVNHTLESFKETLFPKIHGTFNLLAATGNNLDFFLLFSSLNAIYGAEKESNYSAANLFLDSFACHHQSKGVNIVSINWPGWKETGMFFRLAKHVDIMGQENMAISNKEGLRAFDQILSTRSSNVIVFKQDINEIGKNPYFLLNEESTTLEESKVIEAKPKANNIPVHFSNPDWTKTENTVANVWFSVLKKDNLGINDDFFEIGGHSLNGSQVINRLEKVFNIQLEFDIFFDHSTVKNLSSYIENLLTEGKTPGYISIAAIPAQPLYELSRSQKRLWILDQMEEDKSAYNVSGSCQLLGKLNREALVNAFNVLIDRHESLRTTFVTEKGEPWQKVHNVGSFPFEVKFIDLRATNNPMKEAKHLADADMQKGFELDAGPLLRITILQAEDEANVLLFSMHHIISDALSMDILFGEISLLYNALDKNIAYSLPPLAIQYKDYAKWHNQQLEGDKYQELRNFWLSRFEGEISRTELPTDFQRPPYKTFHGNTINFRFEEELGTKVQKYANELGISLFTLLLAATKTLLSLYTGQKEIIVSSPIAGRDHSDLENQIGMFVNMLALRTVIENDDTFESLLMKIRETMISANAHQLYPFDELVKDLNIVHHPGHAPLTDIWVQLIDQEMQLQSKQFGDLTIAEFAPEYNLSKVDITFDFWLINKALSVSLEYNTDLFLESTIHQIKKNLVHILETVVSEKGKKVSSFKLLASGEDEDEERSFMESMMRM